MCYNYKLQCELWKHEYVGASVGPSVEVCVGVTVGVSVEATVGTGVGVTV